MQLADSRCEAVEFGVVYGIRGFGFPAGLVCVDHLVRHDRHKASGVAYLPAGHSNDVAALAQIGGMVALKPLGAQNVEFDRPALRKPPRPERRRSP